mmetsp:Transcript_29396/g.57403  ORF Transcript_29396/g.57403 Transcript_29396/m.57403 type:complete len:205 (-) Transcript_29396:87-701(-)
MFQRQARAAGHVGQRPFDGADCVPHRFDGEGVFQMLRPVGTDHSAPDQQVATFGAKHLKLCSGDERRFRGVKPFGKLVGLGQVVPHRFARGGQIDRLVESRGGHFVSFSMIVLRASRRSSQNRSKYSSQDRTGARPAGLRRLIRERPRASTVMRPPSLSTVRCFLTAARVMSNWPATSAIVMSWVPSMRRMSRRVGSARARKAF